MLMMHYHAQLVNCDIACVDGCLVPQRIRHDSGWVCAGLRPDYVEGCDAPAAPNRTLLASESTVVVKYIY
jgi:hypothetical protein